MGKCGLALIGLLPVLVAAQPDYWPLQVGNQWTYRSSPRGDPFTVEVTDTQTAGGQTYFVVQGLPTGIAWLRMSDDGTLYTYTGSGEAVWAAFGAAEGQSYATAIAPCNARAVVRSKAAKLNIPIGQFDNGLAIDYPPSGCADAGLTAEAYLPYIGLVQRVQTSIAGPVTYDLVYARLNDGLTIVTAPEQSFTVGLDAVVYPVGGTATARLTLRNTQAQPVSLTFPSGQRFDVVVRNGKGDVVYQWSRGKAFTMLYGTLAVTGEKTWTAEFAVPAEAGKYTVEAWLASDPPAYRGQVAIEVK